MSVEYDTEILDYEKFRRSLNEIYLTPHGKFVLDTLERSYVESNVFSSDINTTIYRLGQKELIQSLIFDAKNKYKAMQSLMED
jgi:hypothetical protein